MKMDRNYDITWRRNGKPEYAWNNVEDVNKVLSRIMDSIDNDDDTLYIVVNRVKKDGEEVEGYVLDEDDIDKDILTLKDVKL